MKVAALIPARKNSRRLVDKNWEQVGGRALWLHAYDHAAQSGACHWIAVSSDDQLILDSNIPVVFIRQPQFEQTYNVMQEVVRHADMELRARDVDPDALVLLQPTSPLRSAEDVAACIDMLRSDAVDAVVSVTEGEDDVIFRLGYAGRLEKLKFPGGERRVRPNGAIYAIKTSVLRAGGSWYGDYSYGYLMSKERSVDIDTAHDLEVAQLMWNRLYGPGK